MEPRSGLLRRQGSRGRVQLTPYILLAPAAAAFLLVLVIPTGYALWISVRGFRVTPGQAYGRATMQFVGWDNFQRALADPALLDGLLRLLVFGAISVPSTMLLALVFALALDYRRVRLRALNRTAIFLPYAIPGVLASMMWGFLYLPTLSPANRLAELVGIQGLDLLSPAALFGSLANIAVWSNVGFNMIVLYTALRSIPAEICDAARIDGCNELQLALRIKRPLLTPAIVLICFFSLIWTLQTYSEPITLSAITKNISSSYFPLMKVYNDAFFNDDLSGAAATSLLLALGTVLLSALVLGAANLRPARRQ
jgi:multiple sugar transport system permease protein